MAGDDRRIVEEPSPPSPPTATRRTMSRSAIGETARSRRALGPRIGLALGPLLFLGILFFDLSPGEPAVTRMAAVALWMAVWWITDAVPLAATSLLPLVLYPLLGIMKGKDVAPVYVNHVIFLFIGGFMIALAMERWGLHRRIALWIIRALGSSPARLVLSFMLASALLSMWISNTAAAIMMMAIGMAIVSHEEAQFGTRRTHPLTVGLLLGIAYGCSVGGLATLVGTPPNLSFVRIFEITFPRAESIGFGQWFVLGLPLSLVLLVIVWLLITRVFYRAPKGLDLSSEVVEREVASLGSIGRAEMSVLVVFLATAMLWVFRRDLILGSLTIPGWARLLPYPELIDDGTVAVGMALLLFLIPSGSNEEGRGRGLVDIQVFGRIPWHIVLLFGGGFALASGFKETGLSAWIGGGFAGLAGAPPLVMIGGVCATLTFLTELTSNTATTEMVLPILASAAVAAKTDPLLLMIPATLSASCAFMMPVATPPNAIVFGSGRITVAEMARIGLVINLIGVVVIVALFLGLGTVVFDIDPSVLPDWASGDFGAH
jgi:sodium-dependent dicarboxylate transporter 2/3/5